jgi:hypothetical protein
MKCELLLHPFFYWDIQNICVLSFHRQNTLFHLLCLLLFLLLAEKCSYRHTVFLVNFLLFQGVYEVSFLHPWAYVLYLGQFLFLYSDFYLCPFDLTFGPIFLQPLNPFDKHLPHFRLSPCSSHLVCHISNHSCIWRPFHHHLHDGLL